MHVKETLGWLWCLVMSFHQGVFMFEQRPIGGPKNKYINKLIAPKHPGPEFSRSYIPEDP